MPSPKGSSSGCAVCPRTPSRCPAGSMSAACSMWRRRFSLQIGRAGNSYLLARLGIMPASKPLAGNQERARALFGRLRDVERRRSS